MQDFTPGQRTNLFGGEGKDGNGVTARCHEFNFVTLAVVVHHDHCTDIASHRMVLRHISL